MGKKTEGNTRSFSKLYTYIFRAREKTKVGYREIARERKIERERLV